MGTDLPSFETTVQGRERLILAPNPGAWSLIVLHFSPKQPWREDPPAPAQGVGAAAGI